MRSGVPSDREAITATLDRFEAAQAEVAALSFDAGNWRRMLENYVVAGERVLEPGRAGDARLLDALGASLRHEWLETDESLRARSAGLVPITDDNMGTEWER